MIASLSLLNRAEFDQLPRDLTCFLIPMGGIESHGDHLPLGTKVIHAEDWVHSLAQKLEKGMPGWSFVILPVLPLTVDSITSKLALNVRPHVVRDAIVDQCEQLKRHGFSNFAVVSSHLSPKQLTAIEDAGKIVSRGKFLGLFGGRSNMISVSSALVSSGDSWASPMIAIPIEHAGPMDTGLVLKVNAQWVKVDVKSLPAVDRPKPNLTRFFNYFQGRVDGYWGNPAEGSSERYQQDLDRKNDGLIESIKVVLESGRGKRAFFSPYRHFPLNGSFFKAYILATFFFIMMLMWVIWSLRENFNA